MSRNVELIEFRQCQSTRCINRGGFWPAEIYNCPVCGFGGALVGTMFKDKDQEALDHAESDEA